MLFILSRRKWYLGLILMVIFLASLNFAKGTTTGSASAGVLFRISDVVALVEIVDEIPLFTRGDACGVVYDGRVLESFKHHASTGGSNVIRFGRNEGLQIGRKYFIFATRVDEPEEERERLAAENPEFKDKIDHLDLDVVKCNGIIPGFVIRSQSAWLVDDTQVVVNGLAPAAGAGALQWRRDGDLKWVLPKVDLEIYLRKLEAAPIVNDLNHSE